MIDFSALNNNMISGLGNHEIQEICDVQGMLTNDPSILDETFDLIDVNTIHKDKGLLSEVKDEMNQLQESAIPSSTAYQTKRWSAAFLSFLREKELEDDLKQVSASSLNEYVGFFLF